jgi:hypothetical protein
MSKKKAETPAAVADLVVDVADSQVATEAPILSAIEHLEESSGRTVLSATLTTRMTLDNESGKTTSERVFEIELSE